MKHLLFVMVFLLSLLISSGSSTAHMSDTLVQCSLFQPLKPHGAIELIDSRMMQNGLISELFDINGDGQPDLAQYSPVYGIVDDATKDEVEVIHGVGILYEIDFPPQDGAPDLIYIDVRGEQTCESLVLYYELYKNGNRDKEKTPKGAMISWDGTEIFYRKR